MESKVELVSSVTNRDRLIRDWALPHVWYIITWQAQPFVGRYQSTCWFHAVFFRWSRLTLFQSGIFYDVFTQETHQVRESQKMGFKSACFCWLSVTYSFADGCSSSSFSFGSLSWAPLPISLLFPWTVIKWRRAQSQRLSWLVGGILYLLSFFKESISPIFDGLVCSFLLCSCWTVFSNSFVFFQSDDYNQI